MWCLSLIVLFVIFDISEARATKSTAVVEITGAGLVLVNNTFTFKKKYSYNFKKKQLLELICTVSGVIGEFEIKLENELNIGACEQFKFIKSHHSYYNVSYQFPLTSKSRSISCTARDVVRSNAIRFNSTVDLYYEPDSTTAPPTTNTNTAKPTGVLPVEQTTGPAEAQSPDNSIPWKLIAIGAAAFVTLFVVIASVVMICRQKKPQPTDSDYANLTNDSQHEYQTMPVPVPAPRKPVPTVEGTYSEPKDSNDMSEALYADPNVFRAVKSEETYAEPYNAKNELYTTPIPKAQRGNKLKDDPNYSNVFGKDYVNSKRK